MDEVVLKEILEKHEKWLNDEEGGERANLEDANLRGANLERANLRGANLRGANLRFIACGNGEHILTIQSKKYRITYTGQILSIGCKQYLISEWVDFDDATISEMDDDALDWWKVNKPLIMDWIEANPATPTKE